jgi:hypothetical protein
MSQPISYSFYEHAPIDIDELVSILEKHPTHDAQLDCVTYIGH